MLKINHHLQKWYYIVSCPLNIYNYIWQATSISQLVSLIKVEFIEDKIYCFSNSGSEEVVAATGSHKWLRTRPP